MPDGLLIFIPTYNEAENVAELFEQIECLNLNAELLFLDDASPDGTGEILDRLAVEHKNVHVIHRSAKQGIGSAHATGIKWAYERGYKLLLTMDCDFTHPPDHIPDFLNKREGYDVTVGSRYLKEGSIREWTLLRKTLTRIGNFLTRMFLRMPYDATGAFRLYCLDRIPAGLFELVSSNGYSFFFESLYLLWRNGCSVKEIPLARLPVRKHGNSKMHWKDAFRSLQLLVSLFLKNSLSPKSLQYRALVRSPRLEGKQSP